MKLLFESWRKFLITEAMTEDGAAIAFIFNPEGQIFIVQRRADDEWMPDRWAAPGGGIEPGESPEIAVKRECEEEAQLKLLSAHEFKTKNINGNTLHYFVCKADEWEGQPNLNDEHQAWKWANLDALQDYNIVPELDKDAMEAHDYAASL